MNWEVTKEPTIIATSVVYGLLISICLQAGIFGLWLGLLLLTSSWRYCYTVLRATAQGRKRIPPPDIDSLNMIGQWSVFWHFFFFPGVVLATAPFQPFGLLVAIAVAAVFPASAALMGLTSDLSRAFNPVAIRHFVRTVGADYWSLVLGNIAIFVGASLVITFVLPVFGYLSSVVSILIVLWGLFASFALVGSVLRAHRYDFEIVGELKPREEEMLKHRHAEWTKDLDIAYGSFRSGMLGAGYKTLHGLVDANGDSLEINHWLIENMLDWEDKRYALEVAAKLMPRLLALGRQADALELYHRCRRRDPEYRLPAPQAEALAHYAASVGQTGIVAELGYNRESSEATGTGRQK
jgi:hypothetical protein